MYGHGYHYYGFDPTYFLVLIGFVLCMLASMTVNSTFRKYSKVASDSRITGAMAAERILRAAGITDVTVQHVSGSLTDNYNPGNRTVNLSDEVYGSSSLAAVAVAAHEVGHAIQHHNHYVPIAIRSAIVPVANIGSTLSIPLIFIGLLFSQFDFLITVGIICFSFAVLFQFVTLPVEFNASSRALKMLTQTGILSDREVSGSRKVLRAAALTYVAGTISSLLQLLRLVLLFGGRRRD